MLSNTSVSILVNLGAWVCLIVVCYIAFFHCTRWWCCGGGGNYDIENPPPPPSHTSQQQQRSISHQLNTHHRHGSNPARINPCDIQKHITIVVSKSVNDDHLDLSNREITITEPHPRSNSSLQVASLRDSQQTAPPTEYQHSVTSESSNCPICWEALQHQGDIGSNDSNNGRNEPCLINRCQHKFHVSCIYEWMKSGHSMQTTCPVCRVDIALE